MTSHQPHFVRDYQRLVAELKSAHPLDEAMNIAVGSGEGVGRIEREILEHFGLRTGMALLDLGCGSGRLSEALSDLDIAYTGTDVVPDLLAYARQRSNPRFNFVQHQELNFPVPDESLDMICAFSVFTHLHHHETFAYLRDARRAVRPGGTLVFSFLEFAAKSHWPIFEATVNERTAGQQTHLNQFIERNAIKEWTERLSFRDLKFVDPLDHPWGERPCGQSVVAMTR